MAHEATRVPEDPPEQGEPRFCIAWGEFAGQWRRGVSYGFVPAVGNGLSLSYPSDGGSMAQADSRRWV